MPQIAEDFRVELNVFKGPLDLLLYLVRKHEVDVIDVPIADICLDYMSTGTHQVQQPGDGFPNAPRRAHDQYRPNGHKDIKYLASDPM